ncbi:beta-lactamase/transpeptidase-like protein [Coprinopsis sp. MPI-PUGE-AT-0042]|nr:beta-lactamase/transpeptidase-like protein [Coprinopsis sp. MPI-PUGE-AT-0042]
MLPLSSAIWLCLIPFVVSSPVLTGNIGSTGVSPDAIFKPETLELVQNTTSALGIPGAIIAFTSPKGDGVLTFGNRTVGGDPITPDTHFALASNSKLFLGTILAWLNEKGTKLDNGETWSLDMPLKDFVPNFKMYDETATELATTLDFLEQVSQHTTSPSTPVILPRHGWNVSPSCAPNTEFRSTMTYSNVNYAAITYVVELLTKQSYNDVLDEYIFQPLGMEASSNYTRLEASGAEVSQGWLRQNVNYTACALEAEADPEAATSSLACTGYASAFEFWTQGSGQEWGGGGNVIATGNDLVKWSKEILNPTHIPLSVFERVETPPFQGEDGYAFGTVQQSYRGYNASVHDGALPGSNSLFIRIRNESVGVFSLASDDSLAIPWYQAVYPLIVNDLLGLVPEEADDSAQGEEAATGDSLFTPRPTEPRPSPDIEAYIGGTFIAPGYEPFTLSTINLSDSRATREAQIPYEYLRRDMATLYPGFEFTEGPVLPSPTSSSSLTLMAPLYNATAVMSLSRLPPGMRSSERDTGYIGKFTGSGTAAFTEGGTGFFDGFWGKATTVGNRPAVEEDVEASAEVFFARQ